MTDIEESELKQEVEAMLQLKREQSERESAEAQAIIERFMQSPSRETFAGIQILHERNRERALHSIQQRNNLHQMTLDLQTTLGKLQHKREEAIVSGDSKKAEGCQREYESYEAALQMTQESLAKADEMVVLIRMAIERENKRMEREEKRILALEAKNP